MLNNFASTSFPDKLLTGEEIRNAGMVNLTVPFVKPGVAKNSSMRFATANTAPVLLHTTINYLNNTIFATKLNPVGRILAIDYGKKRIGIAVTDPLQMIATRLTTVPTHEIWIFLKDYFAKENVEKVIVGYPMQMNNQPSEAVLYINPFLKKFQKDYPDMPLEQVDERFTSKMAFQTMIDAGLKKKDRQNKGTIDGVSATIILQSYLEQKNYNR